MEIYKDNQCIVVSDEIWSDIILDGHKHIPTQSVSEDAKNRTIAVYAPSKTFNLAARKQSCAHCQHKDGTHTAEKILFHKVRPPDDVHAS